MKELSRRIILVLVLLTFVSSYRGRARYKQKQCQKITIPLCKEVGYNLTYMPNRFGHKTQFDAGLIIHQFSPLVLINCSALLTHFVCSLYAPMCDPVFYKDVEPCRSFCEDVRDSCEPVMKSNGFSWPEHLKCSNFPTRSENNICMKPEETKPPKITPKTTTTKDVLDNKVTVKTTKKTPVKVKTDIQVITPDINGRVLPVWGDSGCGCTCQYPFIYPNRSQRIGEEIPPCALPCKQYFFKENQMNFITFWLGLWSVLAFVSTLSVILTFIIDRHRFIYTERPMVFIAFCYFFVSLGYIIRLIYGHESIACNMQTKLIRYSATGPAQCTAVFILTYFFTNVAWVWWVVLSMNWFLSSGLKWTASAISSYSQYFHFIAWLIPTVQTMAILAMAAIDGDPVSGLCYVGNHDNNTLTIFIIAPLLIYSMLSLSFFTAGVIALCQSKKQNGVVSKLGVFTFVIFIPAIVLLFCYFYEHNNKESWEKSTNCPCIKDKQKPYFYVYLLKYSMSLILGLVTGFWILDGQTLDSWKLFFKRLCVSSTKRSSFNAENNNMTEQKYYNQQQLYQYQQQQLLRHHRFPAIANSNSHQQQPVIL